MKKRVVVGLSGGVDSSVAAYLLKKNNYDVIGLFMKNWHNESVTLSSECPWLEDSYDAMLVAEKLDIPFQTVDLSDSYKEKIVDYMFSEYENGRTPNPDILCNREIKFDVFLKIALSLGADYVATGHYCQKKYTNKNNSNSLTYHLIKGVDSAKDQSYFLCQLNQKQLSKILFPIGELLKSEVREIARKQNLITAETKDSQGLCFIGKVSLPDFLQQKLKVKNGSIIEIKDTFNQYKKEEPNFNSTEELLKYHTTKPVYSIQNGLKVGMHQGAHFFTKGQRKGLSVGGMKDPLFVIDTDVENNVLYVGQGKFHPGLFRRGIKILLNDIHWVREDMALNFNENIEVMARIRYRQPLEKAILFQQKDALYVLFDKSKSAIAEGQFVAWYSGDELLGSGVIS